MTVGDIPMWGPTWSRFYNTNRIKLGKGARNSLLVVGKIKANAKTWGGKNYTEGGVGPIILADVEDLNTVDSRGENRRVGWGHVTHEHGWLAVEVRTYYECLVNLYRQPFWGLSLCKKQTVLVLVCLFLCSHAQLEFLHLKSVNIWSDFSTSPGWHPSPVIETLVAWPLIWALGIEDGS